MDQSSNIGFAILNQSYLTPRQVVFRTPQGALDLEGLRARALRYALHMQVHGITQDSCVVLANFRGPQTVALALAVALNGARWVGFTRKLPFGALGVTHVLSSQPAPPHVRNPNYHVVDKTWLRLPSQFPEDLPLNRFPGYRSPSDVSMMSGSSGTTGAPKYVPQTYSSQWERISRRPLPHGVAAFTMFPPTTWLGFMFRIKPILAGGTNVWAPTLSQLMTMGLSMVRGSPAQIDLLIQGVPALEKRIGRVGSSGSKVSPAAMKRWLDYFSEIELGYGSSEGGVAGTTLLTEVVDDADIAYALDDDAEVEILDPEGNVCPPDTKGVLRVRSPRTNFYYVGDTTNAASEAFRDGWFYPGDLASLAPDGRLRIHGRVKDQLNMGGVKANAFDIDTAACQAFGVRQAMSFETMNESGVNELHLLATLEPGVEPVSTAAEIRRQCQELRGAVLVPRAIFFVDEIPMNDNGKFTRSSGAELASGQVAY